MKTIARYLIYIGCMLSAVAALATPVVEFAETGELDITRLLVCVLVGFTLIFLGTEANDQLKKRWEQ